jgi:hypothetical protein
MVSEHEEDEEHPQARGGDREEIEGDQVRDVIGEERAPGLQGRRATLVALLHSGCSYARSRIFARITSACGAVRRRASRRSVAYSFASSRIR